MSFNAILGIFFISSAVIGAGLAIWDYLRRRNNIHNRYHPPGQ